MGDDVLIVDHSKTVLYHLAVVLSKIGISDSRLAESVQTDLGLRICLFVTDRGNGS